MNLQRSFQLLRLKAGHEVEPPAVGFVWTQCCGPELFTDKVALMLLISTADDIQAEPILKGAFSSVQILEVLADVSRNLHMHTLVCNNIIVKKPINLKERRG